LAAAAVTAGETLRLAVTRVLAQADVPRTAGRRSQIGPCLPFIRATLDKFPTLTASRLFAMVRECGYCGGPNHLRHLVACHRPRPPSEAYLRLHSLPCASRPRSTGDTSVISSSVAPACPLLMAFVMVLSWSRRIVLGFFLDARSARFISRFSHRAPGNTPLLARASMTAMVQQCHTTESDFPQAENVATPSSKPCPVSHES
jgi:hypothetical protein